MISQNTDIFRNHNLGETSLNQEIASSRNKHTICYHYRDSYIKEEVIIINQSLILELPCNTKVTWVVTLHMKSYNNHIY